MKTLYLCGAGNPEGVRLAIIVNEARKRWDRIVILDDDPSKRGQTIMGVEIAGPFSMLREADPGSSEVSNMVARTTARRHAALEKIRGYGLPFASLIDPRVDVAGVEYDRDITVYQNAAFCAGAIVAEASVVFTGAVVGHGCRMGACCVIAPGAVINARVELGQGVYVGTNASILPDLAVGPWATIGANSAVMQNVPAGATVMGVPAQILIPGDESLADGVLPRIVGAQPVKKAEQPKQYQSDRLRKLRIAQQKFIDSHRSNKN
jgi:sugar O-acyltransferase (sialic acid O-acetyltransferase NeuD family)